MKMKAIAGMCSLMFVLSVMGLCTKQPTVAEARPSSGDGRVPEIGSTREITPPEDPELRHKYNPFADCDYQLQRRPSLDSLIGMLNPCMERFAELWGGKRDWYGLSFRIWKDGEMMVIGLYGKPTTIHAKVRLSRALEYHVGRGAKMYAYPIRIGD